MDNLDTNLSRDSLRQVLMDLSKRHIPWPDVLYLSMLEHTRLSNELLEGQPRISNEYRKYAKPIKFLFGIPVRIDPELAALQRMNWLRLIQISQRVTEAKDDQPSCGDVLTSGSQAGAVCIRSKGHSGWHNSGATRETPRTEGDGPTTKIDVQIAQLGAAVDQLEERLDRLEKARAAHDKAVAQMMVLLKTQAWSNYSQYR